MFQQVIKPLSESYIYKSCQKPSNDSNKNDDDVSVTKTVEPDNGIKKGDASDDANFRLLAGDVTLDLPSTDKIVRIFMSSTFTGGKEEMFLPIFPSINAHYLSSDHIVSSGHGVLLNPLYLEKSFIKSYPNLFGPLSKVA